MGSNEEIRQRLRPNSPTAAIAQARFSGKEQDLMGDREMFQLKGMERPLEHFNSRKAH